MRICIFTGTTESLEGIYEIFQTGRSGSWAVVGEFGPLMYVIWMRYSSIVKMSKLVNVNDLIMMGFGVSLPVNIGGLVMRFWSVLVDVDGLVMMCFSVECLFSLVGFAGGLFGSMVWCPVKPWIRWGLCCVVVVL